MRGRQQAARGDLGCQRLTPARARAFAALCNRGGLLPAGYRLDLARPEHLPSLLQLARECFAYNTPTSAELRHAILRGHGALFRVATVDNDRTVAYSLIECNQRTRSIYANATCATADVRGQGLGRLLVRLRTDLARRLGYRSIRTHIAVDNVVSLHITQAAGYRIYDTLPDYYEDGQAAHCLRLLVDAAAPPSGGRS